MTNPAGYVGRFAPSPTGPLHLGSLVAAIGSYLDARHRGGRWRLRMDDLDTPRNVPGAATAIVGELERVGLEWDGPVLYQSDDLEPYRGAVARLLGSGDAFHCGCSRKDLDGNRYPGTCRDGLPPGREARSVRLRVGDAPVRVLDKVQGSFSQDLRNELGDFVIRRADGIIAYHLATVVDDAAAGVTDVVRGADLLDSTPRQIELAARLGLAPAAYAHLPVAVNADGQKLSKQTHAAPTASATPSALWRRCLEFLGHRPPHGLDGAPMEELKAWAIASWRLGCVPPIGGTIEAFETNLALTGSQAS